MTTWRQWLTDLLYQCYKEHAANRTPTRPLQLARVDVAKAVRYYAKASIDTILRTIEYLEKK